MRKSAVIKHHAKRRDEDTARLAERVEQIQVHGDERNTLLYWQALRQGSFSSVSPLPSIFLMQKLLGRLYTPEDFSQPDTDVTIAMKQRRRRNIGEFITQHILPIAGIAQEEPSLSTRLVSGNGGTCTRVESTFGQLLAQVKGKKSYHPKVSVYFDPATQKPIIIRKTYDNTSGLALAPISADGVYIPQGTVVGFPYRYDAGHETADGQFELVGKSQQGGAAYASYALGPDAGIEPMRLTAWAFDDPLDRTLFAVRAEASVNGGYDIKEYDRQRANMLQKTSLADFQQAAARIMEMTGVTT